jgi:hypothetical protein
VGSAAELQVGAGRLAAIRERHHVVELEETALGTATSGAGKRALSAIALPDLTSNRR